jgi:hypothetical protein
MLLLDEPLLEVQETSSNKFCHFYCERCGPPMAVCGAYKPIPCGGKAIETIDSGTCDVCGNAVCPDCFQSVMADYCMRCNAV